MTLEEIIDVLEDWEFHVWIDDGKLVYTAELESAIKEAVEALRNQLVMRQIRAMVDKQMEEI